MTEDLGIRDLHHGGFQVDREQDPLLFGIFDLFLDELPQSPLAHERRIDDFPCLQRHFRLEHGRLAVLADELDPRIGRFSRRHRLFVRTEISAFHIGDMGLGIRTPCTHLMRMLSGMGLHRKRCPAIGVAFAEHRIDGAPFDFVVAGLDVLLFVVFRIFRVIGKVVTLALQFLDGRLQLGERSAHVGQLDDIGVGSLGERPQFGQIVRLLLLGRQVFGKRGDYAPSQ